MGRVPGRAAHRPTLVSLAREVGVSRQTVSNVINSPDVVRPETRERVLRAIEASGYRPSAAGRALRTQRSGNLGLRMRPVADGISGTIIDRLLHRLTDEAQKAGYRLTLITADDAADEVDKLDELFSIDAIDGCILTDTDTDDSRPERLRSRDIPLVAFGRPWGGLPGRHSWVDVDGAAGTAAATAHLRTLGHRRIGFIGWDSTSGSGEDRRAGWLKEIGSSTDDPDGWSVETVDGVSPGAAAAAELRARGMTALVCASDSLALGAASVLREQHAGTLPVVGFDDTPVARALGLSSCEQPVDAAAALIVRTLADLVEGRREHGAVHALLPPSLRTRTPAAPHH